MLDAYIGVLVLWPLVAGLLCLVLRSPGARKALVLLTSAALAVCAVGLASQTPFTANPNFLASEGTLKVAEALAIVFPAYFLLRGLMEKHALVIIFSCLQLALAIWGMMNMNEPQTVQNAVVCDGLSVTLALVVAIIGSLIAIFAIPYMQHHEDHLKLAKSKQPAFFLVLLAFLGFMNGMALSNDLRVFEACFEATTLCSFLLIGHDNTPVARQSAFRALWMNALGGVFLHSGVLLVQKQFGVVDIHAVVNPALWTGASMLPVALIVAAGCVKAAQMPFQKWLLGAMVAPTPVSALLHSSTMVKAGVFLCLRFSPVLTNTTIGAILALSGAFTFFAGSAMSLGQSNAKKVLAYSTIANLGLIIVCAGIGTPVAVAAGIVLLAVHAATKGLLFLCVGDMEQTIGSRDLEDLRGMVGKSPVTALAACAGALGMVLPPMGMLVGKWATIEAAKSNPVVMALILLGSALAVVCWVRFAGTLMSGKPLPTPEKAHHSSPLTNMPLMTMLACAIGLGMAAPWIDALMLPNADAASVFTTGWGLMPPLFIVCLLAWMVGMKVLGRQTAVPQASPYMGGLPSAEPGTFVGALGKNWALTEGNEYATEIFGESGWTKFAGTLAGLLLLAMVGGAFI